MPPPYHPVPASLLKSPTIATVSVPIRFYGNKCLLGRAAKYLRTFLSIGNWWRLVSYEPGTIFLRLPTGCRLMCIWGLGAYLRKSKVMSQSGSTSCRIQDVGASKDTVGQSLRSLRNSVVWLKSVSSSANQILTQTSVRYHSNSLNLTAC